MQGIMMLWYSFMNSANDSGAFLMVLHLGSEDVFIPYLSRISLSYTGNVGVLSITVISLGSLPFIIVNFLENYLSIKISNL